MLVKLREEWYKCVVLYLVVRDKMVVKRVLPTRISSKYRARVRSFIYDVAHFQSLLRIFILEWVRKTDDIFRLFKQSLLYSLLVNKIRSNKLEWLRKELEEVRSIIEGDEELKGWIEKLKAQKEKVCNVVVCLGIIIQEVNNLKSWIKALQEYKRNPEKFKGKPSLPKPWKLKNLVRFSKDLKLNKVFNADLVGGLNILKVGAKLRRLLLDLRTLFIKLCNPVKFRMWDWIYKSNPESLFIQAGIGASKPVIGQEALAFV